MTLRFGFVSVSNSISFHLRTLPLVTRFPVRSIITVLSYKLPL